MITNTIYKQNITMAVVNNYPFPQGVNLKGTPLNGSGEHLYDHQSSTGNGKQSLWQSREGIEFTGSYDSGKYEDYNNFDYLKWVDAIEKWKHVQSDWSQTDECQSDFIRNKPAVFGCCPFPLHKPPYGYFRLTTCDINENPLPNIPIIPRYGDRVMNIEYSYDNVSWTEATSEDTIYSGQTGTIYLRCPVEGNNQVNTSVDSFDCWKVGNSLDIYYKVDGDLRMLMDSNLPEDIVMGEFCFAFVFSDWRYSHEQDELYINQCIEANVIVPDGGTEEVKWSFRSPFGSKMRRGAFWKEGEWNNGTDEQGEWAYLYFAQSFGASDIEFVQLNFKSWPTNRGIGTPCLQVRNPANTTFYLPDELPEEYGPNRLPEGCTITRYKVEEYGGGHD